jgi:hypothetical protein
MRRTTLPAWSIWAMAAFRLPSARARSALGEPRMCCAERASARAAVLGRRHAAHQRQARRAACLSPAFLQALFRLAGRAVGMLALADHRSHQQSRRCQNEHDDLKLGERCRIIAVGVEHRDQAELGRCERQAGAVDAVPNADGDHGQEQQREVLVVVRPVAAHDHPQGDAGRQREHDDLGSKPGKLCARGPPPACERPQQKRRDHGDADNVADEQRDDRTCNDAGAEILAGEQQRGEQHSDHRGAGNARCEQHQHVANMVEADVQAQVVAGQPGGPGIACRHYCCDGQDERPAQLRVQHQGLGDNHAQEQHQAVGCPFEHDHAERHAEPRIPRGDGHAAVLMDEAHPLEDDEGEQNRAGGDGARCRNCGFGRAGA